MTRRLGITVAAGLAALGLWWLAGGWRENGDEPRYLTERVDRGPLTAVVTATGTVNPVGTVEVGTYVSGPIQAIHVDFNSPVEKGQLLARIDPRPFQVKVDAAAAALENARARIVKARADAALKAANLRRLRELAAQGVISASELDVAVSEDEQARAQIALDEAEVQAAEARLSETRVNLDYTDIVSPVEGVVVSRNVSVGQTVAATFQTPTLFLVAADLTRMRVSASVSESDIGGVAEGQPATFTVDAFPAITFAGRVVQVRSAPVTLQNVVTYDVLIDVDNAELRLKPGMTANVSITTATRADALRVPRSALRFRPPPAANAGAAVAAPEHGSTVWVPGDDGEPRPVTVATGITDDRFTEITSGLAVGDTVIVGLDAAPESDGSGSSRPPSLPRGMRGR